MAPSLFVSLIMNIGDEYTMKKILVMNGSRNKQGNTSFFIHNILNPIKEDYNIELLFPQDYKLYPVFDSFSYSYDEKEDDFHIIKQKILSSDLLIVSSPVYMHSMSSDLKLLLERLSIWSHTFRLNGKPCVVLSTCESNGDNKVIEPTSNIITNMGGNVIATSNASLINELKNENKLEHISTEICNRIKLNINIPYASNKFIERNFQEMKKIMQYRVNIIKRNNPKKFDAEESYWVNTRLIEKNNFYEYLQDI